MGSYKTKNKRVLKSISRLKTKRTNFSGGAQALGRGVRTPNSAPSHPCGVASSQIIFFSLCGAKHTWVLMLEWYHEFMSAAVLAAVVIRSERANVNVGLVRCDSCPYIRARIRGRTYVYRIRQTNSGCISAVLWQFSATCSCGHMTQWAQTLL